MGWGYVFEWLLWIPSQVCQPAGSMDVGSLVRVQIQAANIIFNSWNPNIKLHYWVWPFILGSERNFASLSNIT